MRMFTKFHLNQERNYNTLSSTPSGNLTIPAVAVEEFLLAGTTSWDAPANLITQVYAECLGAGGSGATAGGAGGGPAYAASYLTIDPGENILCIVPSTGATPCGFKRISPGFYFVQAESGIVANSSVGVRGGLAANSTGTVKFSGGAGGDGGAICGGGGGGAAGPNGAGGDGVDGVPGQGGDGGAADNGSGGAGGLGGANDSGADGSTGLEWTTKGSGGGGGGGSNAVLPAGVGGTGGLYGGGGGGGNTVAAGGAGSPGIIRLTYYTRG